ncbi:M13 family metallopeptidase [Silvanigrella aquatica]|uniref:Peptidase M13 C-terminal domain-containing protein n=1 Tax=Silvanigrella aquatica TaxID=1915309 RepID=A0A1L4D371_9BACT|nr:M13 family metallopeptidase [Silvanigrella aquatica]APJ04637.1 hypothetical protein AXG55_12280 [Silvanigrella aquatica]
MQNYKNKLIFSLSLVSIHMLAYSQDFPTIPDAQFTVPQYREFKLNSEISPCNDFYQYVCSSEIANFKIPESKSRYIFSFNDSAEKIKKQRSEFIKSILNKNNLSFQNKMIKNYYNSCMNIDSRKKEEISYIKDYKYQILKMKKEELLEKFATESISGDASFIVIDDMENINNPLIKDVLFYYGLPLSVNEYYKNENLISDYNEIITNFLELAGMPNADKNAKFIIKFEKNIADIYPSKAELRDIQSQDNSVSRDFLISNYTNLRFDVMLKNINEKVNVNLMPKDVFSTIDKSLKEARLEQLRALAMWNKISLNTIKYSYPDFFEKVKDFKNKYYGVSKIEENLDLQCTQSTVDNLERTLDYQIVNNLYSNFPSDRVKNIVEKVQQTTLENIQKNTWLSSEAKDTAKLKIKTMSFQLVKPDKIEDWKLEPNLFLNEKQFLNNKKLLEVKKFKKLMKDIKKPVNKNEWHMSPLTVNAYYNPRANQFVMPLGILQPPFFDKTKSDNVNFGSVGMVVAHEIGHSIDDQGAKFDENGALKSWMSSEDLAQFQNKTKKIVTLFEKDKIDGKLTLGENIADFVGVQNAFQSAFPVQNSEIHKDQQDFFVQYAKTWCGVVQPKEREFRIKTDPHSPVELRVNNQMKLSVNFEKTFSCKQGDPMTLPENERITLW